MIAFKINYHSYLEFLKAYDKHLDEICFRKTVDRIKGNRKALQAINNRRSTGTISRFFVKPKTITVRDTMRYLDKLTKRNWENMDRTKLPPSHYRDRWTTTRRNDYESENVAVVKGLELANKMIHDSRGHYNAVLYLKAGNFERKLIDYGLSIGLEIKETLK